jgi:hypothetical protein
MRRKAELQLGANDRPPGSYPKTGVMSGLATIWPSHLPQCLEAEKAILPTDGGPTDQGWLVQRSTDNPFSGNKGAAAVHL